LIAATAVFCANAIHAAPLEKLTQIPVSFVLNDLLTAESSRYSLDAVVNGARQRITGTSVEKSLSALAMPAGSDVPQSFFQFNILDGVIPMRQYSVFIASTQTPCSIFHTLPSPAFKIELLPGRQMEIHSMMIEPEQSQKPQRSETKRICTNNSGRLVFKLSAPSENAFKMKVQNSLETGINDSEFDFSVPTFYDSTIGAK
jgi:hypothetical protein